jgi:hypothetical protein
MRHVSVTKAIDISLNSPPPYNCSGVKQNNTKKTALNTKKNNNNNIKYAIINGQEKQITNQVTKTTK